MNEDLKLYLNAIGSLTETWMFSYSNFIKQCKNEKEALAHTQSFMTAYMTAAFSSDKTEQD